MKHLSVVFVLLMLLAALACNKKKRLGKQYTKELCRTWRWNGSRSYWVQGKQKPDYTFFADTLMTITKVDETHILFMGSNLYGQYFDDYQDEHGKYVYYGSGRHKLFYYYEIKKVYFYKSTIWSSSSDVTELWADN